MTRTGLDSDVLTAATDSHLIDLPWEAFESEDLVRLERLARRIVSSPP